MNDAFIEIEEQKALVEKLEMEKKIAMNVGKEFDDEALQAAIKKLMMMDRMRGKQTMMIKQRMMAKQRMETGHLQQRMIRNKMRLSGPDHNLNVTLTQVSR